MWIRSVCLVVGMTALTCATAGANPRERLRAEDRVFGYDASLPACDDSGVLGRIQARFDAREPRYWNSTLTLTGIDQVRQTHFRPNGPDLIPRRYCEARARTSDGRYRVLTYNLVEDAGMAGWHGSLLLGLVRFPTPASYSVEWCVSGLDRSWAYAPDCRMTRP